MELPGSSPSQSATDVAQVQSPSRRAIINNGYKTKNVAEVWRGIQTAFSNGHHEDHSGGVYAEPSTTVNLTCFSIDSTVPGPRPSWLEYQPERSRPRLLGRPVSPATGLRRRIFVRWCLDHGASVGDPGHTDSYHCPPLLEIAADVRTVAIFTPLQSQGAQLSPCNLHRAVGSAAAHSSDAERLSVRLAMVKYLVDELGLDINALDTETQDFNHWETLLCYAARIAHGGEEVVRFLLGRGADPYVKDCWGVHDAFSLAETVKEFRSLRAAT